MNGRRASVELSFLTKSRLATQFAPQGNQAEQSAAEQRNCRAAIGDSRRSNADVVQKEEASSVKLYRRRGAQSGEIKCELGVARRPCKNMIENCCSPKTLSVPPLVVAAQKSTVYDWPSVVANDCPRTPEPVELNA